MNTVTKNYYTSTYTLLQDITTNSNEIWDTKGFIESSLREISLHSKKNSLGCVVHDTGNKTVTCITCMCYKIKTEHNNFWKDTRTIITNTVVVISWHYNEVKK